MNINELIDEMESIYFVDKENQFNISMVYYDNKSRNWHDSISDVNSLKALNYSDWRLPNVEEAIWVLNNVKFNWEKYDVIHGRFLTSDKDEFYNDKDLIKTVGISGNIFFDNKEQIMGVFFIR